MLLLISMTLRWWLILLLLVVDDSQAFLVPRQNWNKENVRRYSASSSADHEQAAVRCLSVNQLKQELAERKVSTADVFEKEQLIQRLIEARRKAASSSPNNDSTAASTNDDAILELPLLLTSMDQTISLTDNINLTPSDQSYATIQVQHQSDPAKPLSLLLDTACSGIVLRSSVVQERNLPTFASPVTLTGAAGTSSGTGTISQLEFIVQNQRFGPLPVAIQDIGALPRTLDGIIGLTFLQSFAALEMDFQEGLVRLHRFHEPKSPSRTRAKMQLHQPLGLYSVPVYFGDRGPVRLLVDTGAACTLLNWDGVADLGLTKESPALTPLAQPKGALGSDNVALPLTHRLHVSSTLKLNLKDEGIALQGNQRLAIDVGTIPVLDALPGVGGILGLDALLRAKGLVMTLRGSMELSLR